MLLRINDDLIRQRKLVAYFLSAPREGKSYSFKNKLAYKVKDGTLYAKAKGSQAMLYKEAGVRVDYKKLKDTELRFRDFTIDMSLCGDHKKAGVLSRLVKSLSCAQLPDFSNVDTFDTVSEFNDTPIEYKFNKTRFH